MSLNRARRHDHRAGCRPRLEALEARTLLSGMDVIQAATARATYDVDGSGLSAAVIDTGVASRRPGPATRKLAAPGGRPPPRRAMDGGRSSPTCGAAHAEV